MDDLEQDQEETVEQVESDNMDTNADGWQTDNDDEWVPKVEEKTKKRKILAGRISKSPRRVLKHKVAIKGTPTMFGKKRGRPTLEMMLEWKKKRAEPEPVPEEEDEEEEEVEEEEHLDPFDDDEGEVENAWWAKPKELPDPTKALKDKNKMCHICGEMRVTLAAHLKKMHTNYSNCPQCSGKIVEGAAVPHQCPTRRPTYKCTCGMDYNVREHMHGHLLEKNSPKHEIQCPSCEETFRDFGQYHDHMDVVHPAPFVCNVCGKRFTKKNNLKSHMYSIHVIEKPLMRCEICGAECRGDRNMKRHIMHVHRKATRINCEICKISIFDKVSLRRHMMYKHGLKKEYVCNVCKREFATADALRYHITTHTGDRPYPCPFCPKKFKINSELRKHYRAHKELTIKCPSCSLYCLNEEDLRKHIRRFPAHDVKFLIE
uniref:C2H2-type domain-containing protein n=1 Tax=Phlebotomus papatasi TaxID=29031 RepID=A0A1B0D2G5_PHLPP